MSRDKKPISKQQIKIIHTLSAALALREEVYRGLLYIGFGVRSCKDLDAAQAETFIACLEKEATGAGVWSRNRRDYGKREGFASPEQILFIEGLWREVSKFADENRRQKALQHFVMRVVKVSHVRFLTGEQAAAVIEALKDMRERKAKVALALEAADTAGRSLGKE